MAKPDLNHILAMAKARLGDRPKPINPAQVHEVVPVATEPPRPLAELLADAIPPETDFEREYRRAQELPPAQAKGRGPNLRLPYTFRGEVKVHKLSELLPDSPIPPSAQEARKQLAKAKAAEPYRGTSQERIALSHIKAKQATGQKLTKTEKKLWGKFTMAILVARAGLNRRKVEE
jgi:hypothetical protein